jgi:hypothetical protein
MRRRDVVSVIEAAYSAGDDAGWLQRVAAATAAAFRGAGGAMAILYDSRGDDSVRLLQIACHGMSSDVPRTLFPRAPKFAESQPEIIHGFRTVHFGTFLGVTSRHLPEYLGAVGQLGFDDMAVVNAIDPEGLGCVICLPDRARTYPPQLRHTWQWLGTHIAAGNRLRRRLAALSGGDGDAELPPTRRRRELLQDALARIDHARTRRADGDRAVGLWRGLVDGRWSVVEHFERNGRRYFLAHRNDPELRRHRALTMREQQVLAHAQLGHPNKLIAYSLGLSLSAVGTHLARARRKLGRSAPPSPEPVVKMTIEERFPPPVACPLPGEARKQTCREGS